MDQMNVSITDRLVTFVRRKVKSGRYDNASEVVREALRRMEDDDARALRVAKPSAEDILSDLTGEQLASIRDRVRQSIEAIDRGDCLEYRGRNGLRKLGDQVKAKGRERLSREISAQE